MSLLDARLSAVLSLIPEGATLLDIGTDHCKLPAEGLLSGRLRGAYAADLREGPLSAAERQLEAVGLSGKIPLFLSDGLKEVPLEVLRSVSAVSVAGMGGEVMVSIMENAPIEPPLWILQPMSAVYELMDYLFEKGYRLQKGALAADKERIYRVFTATKDDAPLQKNYFDIHREDPLYPALIEKEEKRVLSALQGLQKARTPDPARIRQEELLLQAIRKAKL